MWSTSSDLMVYSSKNGMDVEVQHLVNGVIVQPGHFHRTNIFALIVCRQISVDNMVESLLVLEMYQCICHLPHFHPVEEQRGWSTPVA